MDGNVYVRQGEGAPLPLLVWGPTSGEKCVVELDSLDELRKLQPAFEEHGRLMASVFGAVFKSPELANYEPVGDVAAPVSVSALPAAIRKLLGWPEAAGLVPGAYPVLR